MYFSKKRLKGFLFLHSVSEPAMAWNAEAAEK
jgi:hypothetical protein